MSPTRPSNVKFAFKLAGSLMWGISIGAVGCFMLIVPPIGFAILVVAAAPLAKTVSTRGKEMMAWEGRATVLDPDETPPWVADTGLSQEVEEYLETLENKRGRGSS